MMVVMMTVMAAYLHLEMSLMIGRGGCQLRPRIRA